MSDNVIKTRVIIRNDNKTALDASSVVLYRGEVAIELQNDGTTKFKVGNGVDVYRLLPYSTLSPNEIYNLFSDYLKEVSVNVNNKKIYITGTYGDDSEYDLEIPTATDNSNGLLSWSDKQKYDGYANKILSDTNENWNMYPNTVSIKDTIYIYTDYQINSEGKYVPGIKIGDGVTFIVDLPFIHDILNSQITNILANYCTVTNEEKKFWNDKMRCYMDDVDKEKLIFTSN